MTGESQIYAARNRAQRLANTVNQVATLHAKHVAGYTDETFQPNFDESQPCTD